MENNFGVLIQAILDSSKFGKSDIEKVQKVIDKYHINLTADLDKANTIAEIKKIVPEIEKALKDITGIDIKINDKDLIRAFNQVEKEATKAAQEEQKLTDAMEKARVKSEQLRQAEEKRQQLAQSKAANKALEEEYALKQKIAEQSKNIRISIDDQTFSTQIEKLKFDFQKFGLSADEAENKVKELRTTLATMQTVSGEDLIKIFETWQTQIKGAKVQLDQTKLSFDKFAQPVSDEKITSLLLRIQNFLTKNTAITKEAKVQLESYINELNSGNISLSRWNQMNQSLAKTEANMRILGKLGMSLKDQMSQAANSFTQWVSVSSAIMAVVYEIKKIPEEVIKINSSLVELSKVSNATKVELTNCFSESAKTAKDLGASISDVINATADWSRLGYNLPDSEELAKVATLYKNVGDGIDIDTANQSLVSTLQGFNLQAKDAISIIDKFNEVANNFPIDTAGIGEALQRSAASFNAANTDLSKSIALITGTNAVVQDPSSVGNMWKTVSMRIRGTVQELEQAGEDTDGMVNSTAELRDLVKGLTGFDIMADKAGTQFKDIYDIVVGIGKEWHNLTDVEQAGLLETLAGKRQGNALAAALNNVSMIEDAYNTAENSAGSALKEQENYEKGIQYSLERLEASFQEFSNNVLSSGLVKGIVDFGNTTINVLDNVFNKLGSFQTFATAFGGFLGIKNIGKVCKCIFFKSLLNYFEYAHSTQDYNQELGRLGLVSL